MGLSKTAGKFFTAFEIIAKKRDHIPLSQEEIQWFIDGVLTKKIAPEQIGAFLMAIYLNKLTSDELMYLTDSMLYSGEVLSFSPTKNDPQKDGYNNIEDIVDKHSTGGVGDKTSFILLGIAASANVKVPMMAGRGLGHTGGTVDKLESIPGIKTCLTSSDFIHQVQTKGMALIGQTQNLAPADKILYAHRDVCATIESIDLITASIMSKKLATGVNGLVFDVKTGNGAFMEKFEDSKALANSLLQTAKRFNKKCAYIISDMNEPLGRTAGHILEMIEVIHFLQNPKQADKKLKELCLYLSGLMIFLAKKASSLEEAIAVASQKLESGEAFEKFRELILVQNGDISYINDPSKFGLTSEKTTLSFTHLENLKTEHSNQDYYLSHIETKKLGFFLVKLGGGRLHPTDSINDKVGIEMKVKIGDKMHPNMPLITLYHEKNQQDLINYFSNNLGEFFSFSTKRPMEKPIILDTCIG